MEYQGNTKFSRTTVERLTSDFLENYFFSNGSSWVSSTNDCMDVVIPSVIVNISIQSVLSLTHNCLEV